ncbi:MAG: hypothetical protein WC728_03880 [Elusimicrobiota bacterium]
MGSLNDRLAAPSPAPRPASAPVHAAAHPAGSPEDYRWAVIEPAYAPSEAVLLVIDPACLAEARAENPGLVTYLMSEAELLSPFKNDHEFMRGVHRIKKILGGWVRQATRPEAGQFKPSIDATGMREVQK